MMQPAVTDIQLHELSQIEATIAQLRQLTQLDVRSHWSIYQGVLSPSVALDPHTWQSWENATLNARDHIAWSAGQEVLWLGQVIQIPIALQAYPLAGLALRIALRWWAEQAEIFVEGDLVQVGDLFDCFGRIVLRDAVQPGDQISMAIRLVSPGHDDGALVESRLIFEPAAPDQLDPGMIADELAILKVYLQSFKPDQLATLTAVTETINWNELTNVDTFDQCLTALRHRLQPWQDWLQQRQIHWIGHAHLDLAWLWPVAETWKAAERTFTSVLQLQQAFPELMFCHSSPALYAWIEANRPELFVQIQAQVAAGRWEAAAGLWVEPELNLICGESLVRQVLYGQRYTQEKFGHLSPVAWLPDSFGFCWQLPQILKQGGIEYFVTQKLRWNDTTEFPYEAFWWQSPDQTQILSLMSPLIGTSIDAVQMATYAHQWEAATGIQTSLWLPGVGDHGGGPTRDMLEVARRWQQSPLFPQLQPTSVEQFCRQVEAQAVELPIWNDELYLEFHRGCYTSHADQKLFNRRCEHLLVETELFSSIAALAVNHPYPQTELEQAWKQVLFNQFHDILPGSSIPQVFIDANLDWQAAEQTATEQLEEALAAISTAIDFPVPPHPNSQPIVLFNSLNWKRTEVVALPLPLDAEWRWQVLDWRGNAVLTQTQIDGERTVLLLEVVDVPPLGYKVYWLCRVEGGQSSSSGPPNDETTERLDDKGQSSCIGPLNPPILGDFDQQPSQSWRELEATGVLQDWILENEYLRVEVSPETGELVRVFERLHQREVLAEPGNQLQFFRDQGQYWDAWNIDPDYASHELPGAQLDTIEWISWGPVQQRLRVTLTIGQSRICQDYVLNRLSPILRIETQVDWQERQVLVKAAFPLTVEAAAATYEMPAGAIARPTLPNPDLELREQAKWEVPALHWADLTQEGNQPEQTYGVSVINNCKYGYDVQPNQLRLTLLRSPNWPDPESDRGLHQFTYALYPHGGCWRSARTVHRGYELNRPLRVVLPEEMVEGERRVGAGPLNPPILGDFDLHSYAGLGSEADAECKGLKQLPLEGAFLGWSAENLILMALKRSEDNPDRWILRCYECHGETAAVEIQSQLIKVRGDVDLLERSVGDGVINSVGPWKIVSFEFSPLVY